MGKKTNDNLLDVIISSRNKLLDIYDGLEDPIVVIDKKFNIISINKIMASTVNSHPKELINKNYLNIFSLGDPKEEEKLLLTGFKSDTTIEYEREYKNHKRKKRHLLEKITPVKNDKGEIVSLIISRSDITDILDREDDIKEEEKNSTIGTMTAGIAHELRNPLTAINMKTQLILKRDDKYNLNPFAKKAIEDIGELTSRGSAIIDDIINFGKNMKIVFSLSNPEEVVNSALELVEYKKKDTIVEINSTTKKSILCDRIKIEQVLANLISNAYDAVNSDGKIIINISEDKKYIIVGISDNGSGISKENIKKIFEPFYSTKPSDKGTGLGLSICHNIIKKHKGYIKVKSEVGKGTTFSIGLLKGT